METIKLRGEYIKLGQALKAAGLRKPVWMRNMP